MRLLHTSILAALLALCLGAAEGGPRFRLLAPTEESFLSGGSVLLIGKVEGFHEAKMTEITDNGKTVGFAPIRNGVFVHQAPLAEGRHEISFSAAGVQRLTVKLFMGKQAGYRYHIETDAAKCTGCHPKAAEDQYRVPAAQEPLCDGCHDRVSGRQFTHGPVAAASCTPCHDPHGSVNGKFLVAAGKDLCMICHSQSLSQKHIEERSNSDCVKCHDPHGSAKAFHLK